SLVLVVLVFDLLGKSGWATWSLRDYVLNFGWGRSYGFVGQIMTLYVALYWALKGPGRRIPRLFGLLLIPYALVPVLGRGDAVFHGLHWVYYFQQMLLGAWLARRDDAVRPAGRATLAALAGLSGAYVGLRVVLSSGRLGDWFFLP